MPDKSQDKISKDKEGDFKIGPDREKITPEKYAEMIQDGCFLCEETLEDTEDTDIFWSYDEKASLSAIKKPICLSCLEAIL